MTETGQQLAEARDELKLIYVHQDQVIELPEQAERLAGDDFCPNAHSALVIRCWPFRDILNS